MGADWERFLLEWPWVWGVALFAVIWLAVSVTLARLAGWHLLARRYRQGFDTRGREFKWKSAALRYGVAYNNALRLTVSRRGLGLGTFFVFRFGHPPLLIPWSDIAVEHDKKFFGPVVRLRLARVRRVPITLPQALADELKAAAGDLWPER